MKEILQHDKDTVKQVRQKEVKKQEKFVGKIKPIKGLTLYKMSLETGIISKVEFEEAMASYDSKKVPKKVKYEQDHIYIQALNNKNAKRKFTKISLELISKNQNND